MQDHSWKWSAFLGRFLFVRTSWSDHSRTSHFDDEIGFFQGFSLITHLLPAHYLGFDESGRIVLIKSEILITTGRVWPVSSDEWRASQGYVCTILHSFSCPHEKLSTPIRNVTLYFRDWRGAASLGFKNSAEITVLLCGQKLYPVLLSNQTQKLSGVEWTQLKTLVLLICRRETLKSMAGRILNCRKLLHEKLRLLGTPGSWNHLEDQKGMFGFTGLSGE